MARSTVAVRFTGDTANLKRALGDIDGKLRSAGGKIAGFGKVAAVGLGGAAVGAAALGKSFIDAATESQKVTKQTEAVIKSMGLASQVSADRIGQVSESLGMWTGVDDEIIQGGQNVLLTFGALAESAGEAGGVFDRATSAALDMSVALGTDMSSASMMVGKALNDPVRGLTALRRSGIQFTKQQEDQIKKMVKAGDVAGAQAIMLGELEKQFGGSAAAQATQGEKLAVTWGNLQEKLGKGLLPVINEAASGVMAFLNAFQNADDGITSAGFPGFMERVAIGARHLFDGISAKVREWWPTIKAAFGQAQAAVEEWWPVLVAAFQEIWATVKEVWPQIQAIIENVLTTVGTIVQGAVAVITTLWNNFGNNILSFVQRVWPRVRQIIQGALTIIRGVIQTVTALIRGDWSKVWEGIKNIVSGVWTAIQGIIGGALEVIRGAIGIALETIGSVIKGAWNGIVDFVGRIPGRLAAAGAGMFDFIKSAFKSAVNWVIRGWNRLEFKIPGFDPPGPGPKFGGFTLGMPNIPQLAAGGEVLKSGLAVVHRGERFSGTRGQYPLGGAQVIQLVVSGRVLAEVVAEEQARQGRNVGAV